MPSLPLPLIDGTDGTDAGILGQWSGVDCDCDVGRTGVDTHCVGKVQNNGLASSKPGGVGRMGSRLRVDGDRAGFRSAGYQRRVK